MNLAQNRRARAFTRESRAAWGSFFVGAGMLASLLGCHAHSGAEAPAATLSASREAQAAFRPVRQRFALGDRKERQLLEPELQHFVASFPSDGLAPLAKIYLALNAVDRGDLAGARALVSLSSSGPGGTTRDLAALVEGAILLRRNLPEGAFEHFLPLIGKLIDPYARVLLDEYMVAAALGARRWYEAVAYMDLRLRDAQEEDRGAAREQVTRALEGIPHEALELMLQTMRATKAHAGYGTEIRRLIVARLAAVAIEAQDTELARRLVESTGSSTNLGDATEGLEELASSGGAPTVDGRVIGLLVSTGSSHLGGRAAEVLAGVVDAVRLSGDEQADHVRLTTRDEREAKRTELALMALASQGAAILVAGLDPEQSSIASAFAERTHIPVILLSPLPPNASVSSYAFVLGEGDDRVAALLGEALGARGARLVAPVGGPPPEGRPEGPRFFDVASCTAPSLQAGESRFPVNEWRKAKVDALLLLGDGECADEALTDALGESGSVRAGAGLEAAEMALDPPRTGLLVATAGSFPLKRGDVNAPLFAWRKRHGTPPTWFATLGRDAAVLARVALRELPTTRTDDVGEVEKRHQLARAALGAAVAPLWSTHARGFSNENTIARSVGVVEVK